MDYALAANESFGIWGGTSERQRRGLRRTRPAPSVVRQEPERVRLRRQWTAEDKQEIVAYADEHGVTAATRRYGVHPSSVYAWRRGEQLLSVSEAKARRASG